MKLHVYVVVLWSKTEKEENVPTYTFDNITEEEMVDLLGEIREKHPDRQIVCYEIEDPKYQFEHFLRLEEINGEIE